MTHETASIIIKGPAECGKSIIIDKIARIINSSGAKYNSPCLEIERNGNDFDNLDQWQIDSIKNVVWFISEETSSSLSAKPQPKEETHMYGTEEINQAKVEANEAIQKLADAVSVSSDSESFLKMNLEWANTLMVHEDKNLALQIKNDKLQAEIDYLIVSLKNMTESHRVVEISSFVASKEKNELRQKLATITNALK